MTFFFEKANCIRQSLSLIKLKPVVSVSIAIILEFLFLLEGRPGARKFLIRQI